MPRSSKVVGSPCPPLGKNGAGGRGRRQALLGCGNWRWGPGGGHCSKFNQNAFQGRRLFTQVTRM